MLRNTDIEYLQQSVMLDFDRIGGDDGNNHLTGSKGSDLMLGFDGNDKLAAKAGDDELFGGAGNDKLLGHRGDDHLYGESGNDKLRGGKGDDHLYGGEGKDKLFGGIGDDILSGGAGKDILYGGAGADIFKAEKGMGKDIIRDFDINDMLDLSAFDLSFDDLNIRSVGKNNHVHIDLGQGDQFVLTNVVSHPNVPLVAAEQIIL